MNKIKEYIYHSKDYDLEICFQLNDWASRSMVSLLTKSKDTVILTVINLGEQLPESDFLPLTVDYEEKFYAGGKIFGSRFLRREGKPSINSILNARLIDRSIRPAFSQIFKTKIHITNTLLSYDPQSEPDLLALLGTSFGLASLNLPFNIIAGWKLYFYNNQWSLVNPNSSLNNNLVSELFVSGTKNKINMIEFEGLELSNDEVIQGCDLAFKEIKKIINFIESIFPSSSLENIGSNEKLKLAESLFDEFCAKYNIDLQKSLFSNIEGDKSLDEIFVHLENEEIEASMKGYVFQVLQKKLKEIFQKGVLVSKIRPDGRKLDEIRKIDLKLGILPRVHGSALFQRGLTHILSTVTLGSPGEELVLKELEYEGAKHFMHHYNFPPYSTGELGSNMSRSPSRREIGHGELAEKAIKRLIPSQEDFPYTIRVVSEVLSSNGSTSMGSVCASSLALFDAGVPLLKHIAGISIGIAYENDNNYALLTDIQGPEDFFGGMDFKVAGTDKGITAIQLDVKIEGLNLSQIKESLLAAEKARKNILSLMTKGIPRYRRSLSPFAPKIESLKIDPSKIGLVIGSGGKTINEIITSTNTKIDIYPTGTIYITGEKLEDIELAKNWIKIISNSLINGEVVTGKVVKILPFGAVLELAPQKTALLHISEISDKRIDKVEDKVKLGDNIKVTIKEVNDDGKIYVSLKNVRRATKEN